MKHLLHGVALAVLTTTCAQAAYAQDAAATGTPSEGQAGSATQPAAGQSGTQVAMADPPAASPATQGLGDIVVTATRRETNLQRTPLSISVVNTQVLQDRHVQSLYDLADGAVPSLRVATFEARQSALTVGIRGIVPLDANQPAREQGVGIYIDGVYLGRQHGLNAALFDVQRIEVLKGPQGTLFGRNTEGGALNIVTARPTGEFGGRISGGIGNYGSYNSEVHLNLPEIAGLRFKIDGIIQHQDATTTDPLAGSTGWNYFDRHGIRAEVEWRPIEHLIVDFAYDNGRDVNTPFYSQLLNANPKRLRRRASGGGARLRPSRHGLYGADRHGEAAAARRGGQRHHAHARRRYRRAAAAERRPHARLHLPCHLPGLAGNRAALDHRLARRFRDSVGQ